jgi:hypothetical protein
VSVVKVPAENKTKRIAVCLAPVIGEEHPLFSKAGLVDPLYVIFEMLQVFEDQPLRLAHGVVTGKFLLRIDSFQVNAFDVIPHFRNAAKATHPLLVALRFVANADGDALSRTT